MGLLLHAGANAIDRAALAALPLPNARGPRHTVRPFIADIELVDRYLGDNGFVIREEAFGVKTDTKGLPSQFFGALEVAPRVLEGEFIPANDFALTVGIRGSYDQSLPRGLAVGSRVFVCDNLAFSAEVTVNTKQTTFIGQRIERLLEIEPVELARIHEPAALGVCALVLDAVIELLVHFPKGPDVHVEEVRLYTRYLLDDLVCMFERVHAAEP